MNEIQDIYESMRERYLDQRSNAYCLLISHTPVFSNNLSLNSLQLPSLPYCSSPSDGKLKIEQGSSWCSPCASVNHHPFAITTCESPRQSFTYLPPCVPTRSANRRQLSCHVSERAEITWPELLQASAQPSLRPTTATRSSDTRPGGNGSRPSTLLLKLS